MRTTRLPGVERAPAVIVPDALGVHTAQALAERLADLIDTLDAELHRSGAVLLRGFQVDTPERFARVCRAIRPSLEHYVGGDSPRRGVLDAVYTSTEYPAHLEVLLHNELSYGAWCPQRVFFGCMTPATHGGQTHIADGRAVLAAIPSAVRERFEALGVTYLQHLWDEDGRPGPGKSWQQTYETRDRRAVARHLEDAGIEFEWTGRGLRTATTRSAVKVHAATGERCWHNQADQWHRELASVKDSVHVDTAAGPPTADGGVSELGNHVTYGDGTPIEIEDLRQIRAAVASCEVVFPWHRGDVLVLDNTLTLHGRKPFRGERQVLVAMA